MKANLIWMTGLVLLVIVLIISSAARFVDWGNLTLHTSSTISVTGEAEKQETNQVAQFYAGVSAVNDDKQTAIDEVNGQMEAAIAKVKEFGVAAEDIKTQNLSVYQSRDSVTVDGRQRTELGQWQANNSIQIKLRDVDQTSELMAVLTESGLTDVSGPNFMLDDSNSSQSELISLAVDDARAKAEQVASSQGMKVGKIMSITEGGASSSPVFSRVTGEGYGGGAPIEPGTSTVTASVSVTFELK